MHHAVSFVVETSNFTASRKPQSRDSPCMIQKLNVLKVETKNTLNRLHLWTFQCQKHYVNFLRFLFKIVYLLGVDNTQGRMTEQDIQDRSHLKIMLKDGASLAIL